VTRLALATRNKGKLRELIGILQDEPLELVALDVLPGVRDVAETGDTFEDNACLKASHTAREAGVWALGEDSGLEVDALGGLPGVYSSRYAGRHGDDDANNAKLVRALEGVADRTARYLCTLALARPGGEIVATTRGVCEGRIGHEPLGKGGFGYDPYFLPNAATASMAQLEPQTKDALSHRGQALRAMLPILRMYLLPEDPSQETHALR
jgi:XTP/dITP diphosphohydrolase